MCGLFGAIGNRPNVGIIRALAILNEERGPHSIGVFDNTGKWLKIARSPCHALRMPDFTSYIDRACRKGWFLAGHTRFATVGKVTSDNAHPFRFGRFIGSHNGCVDYPGDRGYSVDSQYLIDQLHRCNGDYQRGFKKIAGYWGLTWFDGCEFYLQSHDNQIWYTCADGVVYYSSERGHLQTALGFCKPKCLRDGATVKFNIKLEMTVLPRVRVKTRRWGLSKAEKAHGGGKFADWSWANKGKAATQVFDDGCDAGRFKYNDPIDPRLWDESTDREFRDAWEDYQDFDNRLH